MLWGVPPRGAATVPMPSRSFDCYVDIARSAASNDAPALAAALARLDDDPDQVLEALGRHTLIRLVLLTLPELGAAGVPAPLAHRLDRWRARRWVPALEYLQAFDQARGALAARGVPVVLLKGPCFGERLYGGCDRRPMHDLDLLVPARRFGRARRALEQLGYQARGYDAHSRTLQRGDIAIDLHRSVRRAPAFRLDEGQLWRTLVETTVGGVPARTPSDEWTLVFLLMATFEDLGQGSAKLRQLLDLALLLEGVDSVTDWEAFFDRRRGQGLLEVAVNVLAVVEAVFEGRTAWPRLSAALRARRRLVVEGRRDVLLALVWAPRKDAASLAWFARVYPGRMALYLAWFWYGGFPANLTQFSWRRLARSAQVAVRAGTSASPGRAGGH